MKAPKKVPFESAVGDLKRQIDQLEDPDSSLNDSLAAFEVGIGLVREAQHLISAAEQKVQQLTETSEKPMRKDSNSDGAHE